MNTVGVPAGRRAAGVPCNRSIHCFGAWLRRMPLPHIQEHTHPRTQHTHPQNAGAAPRARVRRPQRPAVRPAPPPGCPSGSSGSSHCPGCKRGKGTRGDARRQSPSAGRRTVRAAAVAVAGRGAPPRPPAGSPAHRQQDGGLRVAAAQALAHLITAGVEACRTELFHCTTCPADPQPSHHAPASPPGSARASNHPRLPPGAPAEPGVERVRTHALLPDADGRGLRRSLSAQLLCHDVRGDER